MKMAKRLFAIRLDGDVLDMLKDLTIQFGTQTNAAMTAIAMLHAQTLLRPGVYTTPTLPFDYVVNDGTETFIVPARLDGWNQRTPFKGLRLGLSLVDPSTLASIKKLIGM
jgi:hypothetical protein